MSIVTKGIKIAIEMMRSDAGLNVDYAWRHIGKANFDLASGPLLPKHNSALVIETDSMERVVADIGGDYTNCGACDLRHGVHLVFGGARQQSDRTIPLPDIVISAGQKEMPTSISRRRCVSR